MSSIGTCCPSWAAIRLARIDASLLRKWVAGLEATGLSPTTVGHAYSVCKQVLDSSVEARYLAASPAVIKGLRSRSRPPSTWPSVEQVLALAEAVPDQWRAMILLAGLGGLRLGELLALRREHVDLLRHEVRVATQVVETGGMFYEQTPKTAAGARSVALPDIVVQALDQHLTAAWRPGPTRWSSPLPKAASFAGRTSTTVSGTRPGRVSACPLFAFTTSATRR